MILTNDNYFSIEASKEYFSVSQYKSFMECEAKAMAEIRGEWEQKKTTALLVGSYVDAYFEGTLDTFKLENPEIFKKDWTLKADYIKADEIIKRIHSDKLFMEYMSGEKQAIFTADMFGAKWKIKIDSLLPDKIVDLKIMRSLERIMGKSFVNFWKYDLQMAVYQAVHHLCTGAYLDTFLAVATKEEFTDIEIIEIPKWRRLECLEEVERHLPRFIQIKQGSIEPERCGVCDYCKSTKVLTEPLDFELVGFSAHEIRAISGNINNY